MLTSLQQFRQLEEFDTVAALDKDVVALRLLLGNSGLDLFDILELAEVAVGLTKLLTDKPNLAEIVFSSVSTTFWCSSWLTLPSSRMSPRITIFGCLTVMRRKLSRAAAILVGLAL